MANRQSILRESARMASWQLKDIGRELRVARIIAGATQKEIGLKLGLSASQISRVEHGLVAGLTIPQLHRHAAAVGLKPYLKLYPTAARPLDHAQLRLFASFRERIDRGWKVVLEAPMPDAGDLRAADALLIGPSCRCVVEVITRLADFQAQLRAARRKVRDLGADRLILVVAASNVNRRVLRDAGRAVDDAFPLQTRAALERLRTVADPGADALILI